MADFVSGGSTRPPQARKGQGNAFRSPPFVESSESEEDVIFGPASDPRTRSERPLSPAKPADRGATAMSGERGVWFHLLQSLTPECSSGVSERPRRPSTPFATSRNGTHSRWKQQ